MLAFTREITPAIEQCELTHLQRVPINVERAKREHAAYEHVLASLGCTVHRLSAHDAMADAVFIEDTAVVLREIAVITRPGALSRRDETIDVAAALAPHRPLANIQYPGTLDGGDVLRIGQRILVGLSPRTNREVRLRKQPGRQRQFLRLVVSVSLKNV